MNKETLLQSGFIETPFSWIIYHPRLNIKVNLSSGLMVFQDREVCEAVYEAHTDMFTNVRGMNYLRLKSTNQY